MHVPSPLYGLERKLLGKEDGLKVPHTDPSKKQTTISVSELAGLHWKKGLGKLHPVARTVWEKRGDNDSFIGATHLPTQMFYFLPCFGQTDFKDDICFSNAWNQNSAQDQKKDAVLARYGATDAKPVFVKDTTAIIGNVLFVKVKTEGTNPRYFDGFSHPALRAWISKTDGFPDNKNEYIGWAIQIENNRRYFRLASGMNDSGEKSNDKRFQSRPDDKKAQYAGREPRDLPKEWAAWCVATLSNELAGILKTGTLEFTRLADEGKSSKLIYFT